MSDDLRNDLKLFSEIKEHAADLQRQFTQRNLEFEEYEKMFLLKWKEETQKKLLRRYKTVVQSPDPRDKVLGAVRLMIGTDPIFRITTLEPHEDFDPDRLEDWLVRWWQMCDRIARRPILHDMVLSGVLYGQMDVGVSPIKDMKERAEEKRRKRIDRRLQMSPVLIETWNPKDGYPEFDEFGLSAYYRQTKVSFATLKSRFGDLVPDTYKVSTRFTDVRLHTYYDLDYCCMWVDGIDTPLVLEEHGYPEIPISVTMTDGSNLFERPEDRIQPLLFGMRRANIWEEQNLITTALFNVVFSMGANPVFKHVAPPNDPYKQLKTDFSVLGETVELENGEDFAPVINRNVVPPEFIEVYNLSIQKGNETTIYPQALGAPITREATFSEISLLAQQGRLPLISVQRQSQLGVANVVELALMILDSKKVRYNGEDIYLPNDINIDVTIEVKLPQDKLQLANIAQLLKSQGLVDDEWIHTNILNISNTKNIQHNIWKQEASKVLYASWLQQMIASQQQQQAQAQAQMQAQLMQGMQQGAPQGMPQEMPVPQEMPQGMPMPMPMGQEQELSQVPGVQPGMIPGQAEQIRGIPAKMAGLVPGTGQEMIAPEEEQNV